jgi:hypothetical protein
MVHYSEAEIQRTASGLIDACRVSAGDDPQRQRLFRLMEGLAPVIIRYQLEELNRGVEHRDITVSISDAFGYWVSTIARQSAGLDASIEVIASQAAVILQLIALGAEVRFGARPYIAPNAESGGHA